MIEETLGIIALMFLIGLFVLKMYNVVKQGKLYPGSVIFITLVLGWIFWLLFFMSLSTTLLVEDTITTPDGLIYTIEGNEYVGYAMYLNLNNLLIGAISLFTVFEVLFMLGSVAVVKKPLKARGKSGFW